MVTMHFTGTEDIVEISPISVKLSQGYVNITLKNDTVLECNEKFAVTIDNHSLSCSIVLGVNMTTVVEILNDDDSKCTLIACEYVSMRTYM